MSISLPAEMLRKVAQDAKKLLERSTISVRELSTFVGKTTAVRDAIRVAPLFHPHLQALMNSVISHLPIEDTCKKYSQLVGLSEGAKK